MMSYKPIGTLPVFCPGCSKRLALPDIGPRFAQPPDEGYTVRASLDIECPCGDVIGIVYQGRQPVLIWWRPKKPIVVDRTIAGDPSALWEGFERR